jgi:hypothetical protein
MIGGLFALLIAFSVATSAYTYQQYTANIKGDVSDTGTPQKLNNADLVLPAHK